MRNAIIAGSGMYAPSRVVPNSFFNELLNEDVDTWLRENVHIYERHWAAENESTVDLCFKAATDALKDANILAEDLDLIIVATDTPEYISPSTASKLQHQLGAVKSGTFDLNTACAGFVTALDVASKYIIADSNYSNVLVIGAYVMSKYLNMTDKKTVTLFADGAGAIVLKAEENSTRGFKASELRTQGQYEGYMGIYAGGTAQPINQNIVENKEHLLQFVQKFPKELNAEMWTDMTHKLLQKTHLQKEEITQFFITQININSIWDTMQRLELPREKAHTVMHHYGYTGSACIPMAFHEAKKLGKIKPGDNVIFIGSGGGLAFASALFTL